MSNISIIPPDSELYEDISGSLKATKKRRHAITELYNEISEAYNRAEVDGFLVIESIEDKRLSNLEKVFLNRGLKRHIDYEIYRPLVDKQGVTIPKEQRKTLMKKLTDTVLRVV